MEHGVTAHSQCCLYGGTWTDSPTPNAVCMVEPGATAEVPYLGGGGAFLKSLSGRSTDFCLKKFLALDADPEAKEAAS